MLRQLAQCPYCKKCAISLNDYFGVVFNPDAPDQAPCEHLIRANGGCSQTERTLPGTCRVVGSTAIQWNHSGLRTSGPFESLVPYLEMLVQSETGWEFAPAEPFQIQRISVDSTAMDRSGKECPTLEADGWAVFALRPIEFLADIVACRDKQSGAWREATEQQQGGLHSIVPAYVDAASTQPLTM